MWNDDFLLSQEWALGTPEVKTSGHLDDLGSSNRLAVTGDGANELQFQDASNFEAFSKDDVLGLDWMESTDIGSLLAAFDDQSVALPFGSSEVDFKSADLFQSADWIENALPAKEHGQLKLEQSQSIQLKQEYTVQPEHYVDQCIEIQPVLTDSFLSPPESPDHSTVSTDSVPDINVESGGVFDIEQNDFIALTEVDIYTDLTSVCNSISECSTVLVSDNANISFSLPSSPDSSSQSSQSSIIESSPELYKVICTSSSENRVKPYPTSNPKKQKSTSSSKHRRRQPAQPVPEHVIMEQLDKKDRKKLQNKNAAIRYRMKKKEEALDIVGEEQQLEDVNTQLKTKVDDLQREIKYMKSLMEDVCRAKGIAI